MTFLASIHIYILSIHHSWHHTYIYIVYTSFLAPYIHIYIVYTSFLAPYIHIYIVYTPFLAPIHTYILSIHHSWRPYIHIYIYCLYIIPGTIHTYIYIVYTSFLTPYIHIYCLYIIPGTIHIYCLYIIPGTIHTYILSIHHSWHPYIHIYIVYTSFLAPTFLAPTTSFFHFTGLCPVPDPEDTLQKSSSIENLPDPIPELFDVLTEEEDFLQRWTTFHYSYSLNQLLFHPGTGYIPELTSAVVGEGTHHMGDV